MIGIRLLQGWIDSQLHPFFFKILICINQTCSSQVPTTIPSIKKEGNGCSRDWCVRRESLLQDRLPVKFQDVKFKDPNFKCEIFMRINMKQAYFANYFIILLSLNTRFSDWILEGKKGLIAGLVKFVFVFQKRLVLNSGIAYAKAFFIALL